MSKDAYYFSHDSNASNDPKILSMRCDYGLSGYGMYWIIAEALRNEADYKLPFDKCTFKALAMQMHCKNEEVEKFINDCIFEYKLFENDTEKFWSNTLLKRMEKREEIKIKRKAAAEKRWKNNDDKEMEYKSNAKAMQNDAKERKGKERKGKESKDIYAKNAPFFDMFWDAYPKKKGRKTAEQSWGKIKDLDIDLILSAIKKQKETKEWKKAGGQYIPYPATWLNQERWKDEIDAKGNFDHIDY